MEKVSIELSFEADKLEALEYCLEKERTTAKKKMAESLQQLYEEKVPEAVREYLGEFRAVVPLGADRVGLVCPRKPRVFDVRDFRFTLEDGKVSNLAPV